MIKRYPEFFCKFLILVAKFLPIAKIHQNDGDSWLYKKFRKKINKLRNAINRLSVCERDKLVRKYLIDLVNTLFDKNYANCAQYTLLSMEEWFLSQRTDQSFEEALSLFSQHAIDAGLRYRDKFPLSPKARKKELMVAFTGYWTSNLGTEGIIQLCKKLPHVKKFFMAMRVFDNAGVSPYKDICENNNVKLVLPQKKCIYNIWIYRKLFEDNPVDIVFWIMPPMHMFFFFAWGLAKKQVWFSLYLRSNLNFPYLDGFLTPGGSGYSSQKFFNGKMWNIIPQVTFIHDIKGSIVLFSPARLEKFKQPDFFDAVIKIMKACPQTVIKWTGYFFDKEVSDLFKKADLQDRNYYIPWQDNEGLLKEIRDSDVILSTFPLGLGTTEMMASLFSKPIVSMYNEECSMYWRDAFWEAKQGDPVLREICFDANGNSIIKKNKSINDYVEDAISVINDKSLADKYAKVYHDAYDYTYLNNPNELEEMFFNYAKKILGGNT